MNPNPQKPWPGDLRQPPGPGGVNYPVVLIVDDHDDTREMLKTLLGMVGCHVIEAEDGERALNVAEKARPEALPQKGLITVFCLKKQVDRSSRRDSRPT
jgi:hypoxanthine phosphoribosyltransferase